MPAQIKAANRWVVLAVAAFGAFMAFLDTTIVNIALPSISHSFRGAPLAELSWILNAYNIVFAALLVRTARGCPTSAASRSSRSASGCWPWASCRGATGGGRACRSSGRWPAASRPRSGSWRARRGTATLSSSSQPVLDAADADGVPAYIEASSERNAALYERLGFRTTEVMSVLGSPPLRLMLRPAPHEA